MKKQFVRVVKTTMISRFFKTAAIVLMLSGAASHTASASAATEGAGDAVVTHLGSNSNSLFFQVKFDNTTGEKFTILVKDGSGVTLYRGTYNDKDFNRKFVLPKGESGKLTFIVKNAEGNKVESFEINTNTRLVEEIVVKKIN
jgi:hypothetical protein